MTDQPNSDTYTECCEGAANFFLPLSLDAQFLKKHMKISYMIVFDLFRIF